jgi:hypothetical protein
MFQLHRLIDGTMLRAALIVGVDLYASLGASVDLPELNPLPGQLRLNVGTIQR